MILYDAESIRKKIQYVLGAKKGRRYAVVAFVGQDVLDFIREPAGLTVYCWPNVAATHPDGVERLLSRGATVYFVDRLHVKLYWSESGGAVLGSCNLTQNALGGTGNGLYELAYFIKESSHIDIDALLRTFRKRRQKVNDAVLKAYRKKYNGAAARRDEYIAAPRKKETVALPTFAEFLRQSRDRKWSITFWGQNIKKSPSGVLEAVEDYEDQHGLSKAPDRFIDGWVECDHKPSVGEWVLECRLGNNYGRLSWLFTHVVAKPRKNSPLWCATQVKMQPETPPFDCKDKRFLDACHAFLNELDTETSFVMTDAKLRRLEEHYRGEG